MTTRNNRWMAWAALLGIALVAAPDAAAFFPRGDFVGNQFVKIRWPKSLMDTNGDGDVSGDNEGVPITLEAGVHGFTAEERRVIQEAFETWEAIPSSYIAFRFTQPVRSDDDIINPEEPLSFNTQEIGSIDGWNYVGSVPEDSDEDVLGDGIAIASFITYVRQDTFVEINGETIQVNGPAILDFDCALLTGSYQVNEDIDTSTVRIPLQGLMTRHAGHALGLEISPLYSFDDGITFVDENGDIVDIWFIEPEPIALRDAEGNLQEVGVTPTMFPELFYVRESNNVLRLGRTDLAPDDIAGATWIYPREDRTNFFDLSQEAWFTARQGVPTAPIPGAHIRAWCDTDNNPATARVPMYDTFTGLYETAENSQVYGRFHLYEMFKVLETAGGVPFDASYTITMHTPLEFPAFFLEEGDYSNTTFDSTHTGEGVSPLPFTELRYLSQTFVEGGENIFTDERADDGTPLKYDAARRTIVSADSGQTLAQILPGRTPMFGDTGTVCPLNMVVGGLTTAKGPDALRRLRDQVLLHSPLGAMVSDAYYRAAPGMSRFLLAHPAAFAAARGAAWCVEGALAHWRAAMATMGALGALLVGLLAVWRKRRLAAVAALMVLLFVAGTGANAQGLHKLTLQDLVAMSDSVVVCKVVGQESRLTEAGKIVTDVTVEVSDSAKGRLNRGGTFYFTQYGGQVGELVTTSAELPEWKQGDEAVVFFKESKKLGLKAVGGRYGKFAVVTDPETGAKKVRAPGIAKRLVPAAAAKRQTDTAKEDGAEEAQTQGEAPLESFLNLVESIAEAQETASASE